MKKSLLILFFNLLLIGSILHGQQAVTSITEGFEDPSTLAAWTIPLSGKGLQWHSTDSIPYVGSAYPNISNAFFCAPSSVHGGRRALVYRPVNTTTPAAAIDTVSFITPELNLTGHREPILTFWYYSASYNSVNAKNSHSLRVYTSENGIDYTEFSPQTRIEINRDTVWRKYEYALSKDVKYVKITNFYNRKGNPWWSAIDDFFIGDGASGTPAVNSISEGFEDIFPPSADWKLETLRTDGLQLVKTDTCKYEGAYALVSPPVFQANQSSTLTTPLLDLTKLTLPMLSFYYKNARDVNEQFRSEFIIFGSVDGKAYVEVERISVSTSNRWERYTLNLHKDYQRIQIAISSMQVGMGGGDGLPTFIDNLYIGERPEGVCLQPKDFHISATTPGAITFDWAGYDPLIPKWQLHYGACRNPMDLPTYSAALYVDAFEHPYMVSKLKDTVYHFRLRTICPNDTSMWTPIISMRPPVSCPAPQNITISDIERNGFEVKWQKGASEVQYILKITGTNTAQSILVSDTSYIFDNLNPNTQYTLGLCAYCAEDDSSKWVYANVKTACNAITENELPWLTDFEGIGGTNQFPDCMSYTKNKTGEYSYPVGTFSSPISFWIPRSGSKAARFNPMDGYRSRNDDYLWSPAIELKQGYTYRFSFWYALADNVNNVYSLETKIGKKASMEAMTVRIGDSISLKDTTLGYKLYSVEFEATESDDFFFGIHAITPEPGAKGLNIDDISVERVYNCTLPTELTIDSIQASSAFVKWTDLAAETWQIRYGKVDENGSIQSDFTQLFVDAKSEISLVNLLPEIQYGLQIRAICAEADSSGWTLIQKFTTLPTCPKPSSLVISEYTTTGFEITWTAGGSETQWDISVQEGRVNSISPTLIRAENNRYVFTDLKPNRYYTINLRANCAAEDQSYWIKTTGSTLCGTEAIPYSESFESILQDEELPLCMITSNEKEIRTNISPEPDGAFSARTGIKYIYFTSNSNSWIYTPSLDLKAGQEYEFSTYWLSEDTINKLTLNYGLEKNNDMELITEVNRVHSGEKHSQIKGHFTPVVDGKYYLGIYAQTGNNGIMSVDDLHLREFFTCAIPSELNTFNITTQSVRFIWRAAADSFALSYRIKDSLNAPWIVVNTKDTSYTPSDLQSDAEYIWHVKSICSFGNSEEMAGPNFRTRKIVCSMPTQTRTSEITHNQAKFSWDSEGSYFEIRFKALSAANYRTETVENQTYLKALSLESNTEYMWSVRNVCNETEPSEWTLPDTLRTLVAPCATPVALNVENITSTGVSLSWGSVASNFQVRYAKKGETEYILKEVNTKTLSLENLSPKTAYTWAIRAVCAVGDTSAWADDTFTTEPLGIETSESDDVRVYTNNGSILLHNPGQNYFQKIEVVNIAGQVIRTHGATQDETIEIKNIQPMGVYILRLLSKNDTRLLKIMIR